MSWWVLGFDCLVGAGGDSGNNKQTGISSMGETRQGSMRRRNTPPAAFVLPGALPSQHVSHGNPTCCLTLMSEYDHVLMLSIYSHLNTHPVLSPPPLAWTTVSLLQIADLPLLGLSSHQR